MDPIRTFAPAQALRCTAVGCPFADSLFRCWHERRRRGSRERLLGATETRTRTDTASTNAHDESSLRPDRRGEIPADQALDAKQIESLHARPDARYRVRKDRRVHTCGDRAGVAG